MVTASGSTGLFQRSDLPLYREPPGADGSIYPEVMNALAGGRGAVVRVTEKRVS
jgi:two-component system sensor histidine kinase ChvG